MRRRIGRHQSGRSSAGLDHRFSCRGEPSRDRLRLGNRISPPAHHFQVSSTIMAVLFIVQIGIVRRSACRRLHPHQPGGQPRIHIGAVVSGSSPLDEGESGPFLGLEHVCRKLCCPRQPYSSFQASYSGRKIRYLLEISSMEMRPPSTAATTRAFIAGIQRLGLPTGRLDSVTISPPGPITSLGALVELIVHSPPSLTVL